ncbi:MAG: hypothetical protein ACRDT4_14915 [Micromonosporaceae bacterium]
MEFTRIAGPGTGPCPDGVTCPTVYETDRGTVVVQGYRLSEAELAAMNLPDDEYAVEIPKSLLEEVVRAYRR